MTSQINIFVGLLKQLLSCCCDLVHKSKNFIYCLYIYCKFYWAIKLNIEFCNITEIFLPRLVVITEGSRLHGKSVGTNFCHTNLEFQEAQYLLYKQYIAKTFLQMSQNAFEFVICFVCLTFKLHNCKFFSINLNVYLFRY